MPAEEVAGGEVAEPMIQNEDPAACRFFRTSSSAEREATGSRCKEGSKTFQH